MKNEIEERFEDWKGREAIPGKHGGIGPASIACVVEVMENIVFVANGFNFVEYFMSSMHYSPATAANMVTNFMGTTFLLTLLGGFIADSFLTNFTTFIIFCCLELMGLILLTFQSYSPKLQPESDKTPSTLQATILFTGLYAMAFGAGGIKASLPTHGGDQLDRGNPRLISRFFNWFYFSICCGSILAVTIVVSIEESKGWFWSFTISAGTLALALLIFMAGLPFYRFKSPTGSSLTRITKVIVSAARNRNKSDLDEEMMQSLTSTDEGISHTKLKCLDKAMLNKNISAIEVAETRTFLGLLLIFFSTIAMNCCLAQLSTFSVQQGMIMDRKLFGSFEIPVPSLVVIPLLLVILSIPLYDYFGKGISSDISPSFNLNRIRLGLALSSFSMVVAAIVETTRKYVAVHYDFKISVLWLMVQYLMLTVADTLAFGGMLDFFYREAPSNMKSMSTALGWCSAAFGFFLSTALVEITNTITGWLGHQWLGGEDLNETSLELFYVVLFVLNTLNLLNYNFWTKGY
ncbi:hypothetical protein F2Q70_00025568 [Brassica cretica]|uniref:Major facilitator superfamily (MFS) profile domain-containing protein n=4 Tax=Brassica TaxID=3705 RepID=A0A3N6QQJ7_BRACR|nr:PREDICTED: protein NRT1/ PTR FAMILY 4.2-like [Brassica oleracea var. oleracea]XP_022571438.1 protein NRT1/ PTR FAMILY 4.2-like [Brassica napus]KAF2603509.1 hypothetical protein F2Q70_00025568 [Brassica cretica]KAG2288846.1 hypothetical protein Bca52824_048450 [Brassica carinata]KAF3577084.1 hypothetical protein DY000_02030322 [Brassica cretica]KAH0883669.1 hypothetical protein HID58_059765 [Brassica napus]CAF1831349.1 unnamed protein product [Brassica napus]